ncbi:hypothetical protein D8674_024844 [Pyrus ussuriensis x Pyrus communis]|uniref:Uncharacterized protein n=1 Tax=Pyrus ussuriensis x Pyrus communis TaxID=2448454 RepID=A0A5N5H965_9ROSA|nr:hypothetical protein D8674_024844 [Pyrus ussuriensis x Pyrus communis]
MSIDDRILRSWETDSMQAAALNAYSSTGREFLVPCGIACSINGFRARRSSAYGRMDELLIDIKKDGVKSEPLNARLILVKQKGHFSSVLIVTAKKERFYLFFHKGWGAFRTVGVLTFLGLHGPRSAFIIWAIPIYFSQEAYLRMNGAGEFHYRNEKRLNIRVLIHLRWEGDYHSTLYLIPLSLSKILTGETLGYLLHYVNSAVQQPPPAGQELGGDATSAAPVQLGEITQDGFNCRKADQAGEAVWSGKMGTDG